MDPFTSIKLNRTVLAIERKLNIPRKHTERDLPEKPESVPDAVPEELEAPFLI